MKFDPANYRRDSLVQIMRNHATNGEETLLRRIRGVKDGIFFERKVDGRWKGSKIDTATIDSIILELFG